MVNTSTDFTRCHPQTVPAFIPFFMSFNYFIGFALNSISLWIFWFQVKQWNSTVILQFNLAISDAIVTSVAPLIIIYSFNNRWTFGNFFCQFTVFVLGTHVYGSIYFLTLISLHRYFTVVHTTRRRTLTTKPFITKLCIGVWGCMLLQGTPVFFALKTSEVDGVMKCLCIHQTEQVFLFFIGNWLSLFSGLLIPFTITLVCYSLLSRYILKVNPVNTLTNVMVSKSVQTIFVCLIIFIICFIPVHITRAMAVTIVIYFPSMCSLLESLEMAYYITATISGTNCCMDPILYVYASDKFKQTLTGWCRCLTRRGEDDTIRMDNVQSHQGQSASERRGTLPTVSTIVDRRGEIIF